MSNILLHRRTLTCESKMPVSHWILFCIRKKCKKINEAQTWVNEVSDILFTVVQWSIQEIFGRKDDGALLIDVTILFEKEGDKLVISGAMIVADPFGEALIGSDEDGCCVSSRDSCACHSGCGVACVTDMQQDAAAPSSTAITRWRHDVEMWVGG